MNLNKKSEWRLIGRNGSWTKEKSRKVTDFPLLQTIKGILDRVQEGIIGLSFHMHHVPNNYYFSTICRIGFLI